MKVSIRVWFPKYKSESEFQKLTSFLLTYKEDIDEIAFQNEYHHHGYIPLEDFGRICEIIKDRTKKLKGSGFKSVGTTMLNTMGHQDEAWD